MHSVFYINTHERLNAPGDIGRVHRCIFKQYDRNMLFSVISVCQFTNTNIKYPILIIVNNDDVIKWKPFSALLFLLYGEFTSLRWILRTKASDWELWCFLWSAPWLNGWVRTWWRHQMETCSALLAICEGNSPVTGEFPAQRPVNNREAGDLRRHRAHYDVIVMNHLRKSQNWHFIYGASWQIFCLSRYITGYIF